MEDRIEHLFQEWHRLGGAVLLAKKEAVEPVRCPEEVIAESTAHCRESGRLMWVVLDWLIHHIEQIDAQRLLEETRKQGDLSVLGVLCDAAHGQRPHPKLERIMEACSPNETLEPFFFRVARSPLARRLAQQQALPVFRRWNYLSNELRYLHPSSKDSTLSSRRHAIAIGETEEV